MFGGGLLFIALGMLLLWGSLASLRRDSDSTGWPTTTASIETSQKTLSQTSEGRQYFHELLYRYRVNDVHYEGQIVCWGADQRPIETLVALYPAGSTVTVWFDPTKPRLATLEPGSKRGPWIGPSTGAALITLGLLIIYLDR